MQNGSQLGGQVLPSSAAGQRFHSIAVRNLRSVLSGENFSGQGIESAVVGLESRVLEQVPEALRGKLLGLL